MCPVDNLHVKAYGQGYKCVRAMPSFPLDDEVKEYILRDDNLLTFSKAFLETRGKALLKAYWGRLFQTR